MMEQNETLTVEVDDLHEHITSRDVLDGELILENRDGELGALRAWLGGSTLGVTALGRFLDTGGRPCQVEGLMQALEGGEDAAVVGRAARVSRHRNGEGASNSEEGGEMHG